ncbi:MAG: SLC13 family permease [Candidatus Cyclobacteriaceae bacterium M2_1C_046]
MSYEEIVTIVVIILAMVLFATEYLTVDLVALLIIATLVISGVLVPEEGVKGFANRATITVAAMFVISEALLKAGFLEAVSPFIGKIFQKKYLVTIASMMIGVGSISAFINNTPVVATLIPVVSNAARKAGKSPSKYLIPLSYGAIFGGTCTLIGTSTNILVSGIAVENGLDPFSMFLLLPLGLIFFLAGIIYMCLIGHKLLPERLKKDNIEYQYQINEYLTELKIVPHSDSSGKTIEDIFLKNGVDVEILQVKRDNRTFDNPKDDFQLKENDVLFIRGDIERIKELITKKGIELSEFENNKEEEEKETFLLEVVILPNSSLIGKRIGSINFTKKYHTNVLAIRQSGRLKYRNLKNTKIKAGDILLLQTNKGERENILELESKRQSPFMSISQIGLPKVNKQKLALVIFTVVTIVVLATLGLVNIMIGAIAGIVFLNLTNVLNMQDTYSAIDWQVIFLLAGALSLGTALQETGLAGKIGDFMIYQVGKEYGTIVLISSLYLTTSILTEVMSNNAAVALLAPIAISISGSLGLNPVPLLLAITFAGSASFMTPVGYQTNTMVHSAGPYKFHDFMKVGTPLNIIFWLIATFLIPIIYPL